MKCTHCGRELTNIRKSNPIPNREPEARYIMSSCCNNVMIATFVEGEMTDVQPTPNTDTPETRAMMQEAAQLFRMSGSAFYTQKVSSTSEQERIEHNDHVKEIIDSEEAAQQKDSTCTGCTHCTCGHNDSEKVYHKDCYDKEFKKQNIFKRLAQKFLNIFKR